MLLGPLDAEKPINIITKNLEKNEQIINELKKYENFQYEIEEEKNILKNKLEKNEHKFNLLKEIKLLKEKNNLENEKIKIKENFLEENKNKINEIKNKIEKINNRILEEKNNKNDFNKNSEKNKLNKKLNIIFCLVILLNVLWFIFIPQIIENIIIKYIFILTIPIYFIVSVFLKNKLKAKIKEIKDNENKNLERINSEKISLENEEKIYENTFKQTTEEINKIKLENSLNNNYEENILIKKYEEKIEKNEIRNLLKVQNINTEIYLLENEISNSKNEINKLELKKDNIEPEMEKMASIEEEIYSLKKQYENLEKMNESIELAKKLLSRAYEKMKSNVSPIFTKKLSSNISKITNEKYCKLHFNDEQGLIVELDNGNYIPADRLSIGTIDQLYLSLRLAMLDEISKEKVPIILDEAFAYYDDERLKNILKFLTNEFTDRQIIILTCTNRELRILEELKISFNTIIL